MLFAVDDEPDDEITVELEDIKELDLGLDIELEEELEDEELLETDELELSKTLCFDELTIGELSELLCEKDDTDEKLSTIVGSLLQPESRTLKDSASAAANFFILSPLFRLYIKPHLRRQQHCNSHKG